MERYARQYPWLSSVLPNIVEMLDLLPPEKSLRFDGCQWEFEARFGDSDSSPRFIPGVSRKNFMQTIELLESFEEWARVEDWELSFVYLYSHEGGTWRTCVSYGEEKVFTCHQVKHNVGSCDISPGFSSFGNIRVSLNVEEPLSENELPSIVNPYLIRRRLRKRFLYSSSGTVDPTWAFDLTIVAEGSTMKEVEKSVDDQKFKFEIECECLDLLSLLRDPSHDYVYVTVSLLLKMRDFLEPDMSMSCGLWRLLQKRAMEPRWVNSELKQEQEHQETSHLEEETAIGYFV